MLEAPLAVDFLTPHAPSLFDSLLLLLLVLVLAAQQFLSCPSIFLLLLPLIIPFLTRFNPLREHAGRLCARVPFFSIPTFHLTIFL